MIVEHLRKVKLIRYDVYGVRVDLLNIRYGVLFSGKIFTDKYARNTSTN